MRYICQFLFSACCPEGHPLVSSTGKRTRCDGSKDPSLDNKCYAIKAEQIVNPPSLLGRFRQGIELRCRRFPAEIRNRTRKSWEGVKNLPHNFRERKEQDGLWFTLSFLPLVLLSIISYLADVWSDIFLAIRYINQGDIWWGSLTACFVIVPWISYGIYAFVSFRNIQQRQNPQISYKRELFPFILALFNLYPVALLLLAAKKYWNRECKFAKDDKSNSQFFRLFEILFESVPQASLQIYIAAQQNHVDSLLIFSIVTSLISVSIGMTGAIVAVLTPRKHFLHQETLFLSTA